ncbi:hypothetical protein [Vibrio cholerae]|uniref:hypothetical protein n=1 Tax=Vibrio cholerae TaxID=666 RepID=UPI00050C69E2|nr:hypothetical protein [Vibrio cholerae]NOE72215.1 hypothetical protein [Vibrio cholerae]NOE88368.1 hypothetical protein [Vibrio cholerae]NOE90987.1 hypothetical protein [Vibrio cholerae]NOF97624.1 hypothetical protein [Vibrio cholerae]
MGDFIYYDNEPNIGINVYFVWGHRFFKNWAEFEQYLSVHYRSDPYQLVEITNENYNELLLKGVFHAM